MLAGFIALVLVIVGGTVGYYVIGGGKWPWLDCAYMFYARKKLSELLKEQGIDRGWP